MEQRILECLEGREATEYILPFFWQHGETHKVLEEEIEAIQRSGISEFCVESRTHEQFGEEKWWVDFGFILKAAKKRKMRVWLLDDKKFPTGYANNYIEDHQELRALHLRMEYRDFVGPKKDTAILPVALAEGEEFASIVAYKRTKSGNFLEGEGIELLSCEKDGLLWLDIPEGLWRVYYVIYTKRVTTEYKKNFIDMMSEESCKAMLTAVYEPHYEHYKEYFGNTFAGFFSDEPGIANEDNYYEAVLGREGADLPWNHTFGKTLAERMKVSEEQMKKLLPALWHEIDGLTPMFRENYMEIVTETFSKNFGCMLGDWCREHGVLYIGHIIEDRNAHQRLGHGAGHFFRAMKGMDMAGCDIVLHQMIPGYKEFEHTAAAPVDWADPAFFDYTLPKLAASQAHIEPWKKGRSMCEVYGAFGWACGIPTMKYITDLMLVGGVNHFVPHAFTPKYPDPDCPPHFYARGENPQFLQFGHLMRYMQRMSHVLSEGIHQAGVAVYYNAEAEWSGQKCMLQQEICKELTRHQIDFDLLPQDTVCQNTAVKKGRLLVNKETYGALIVPYSRYLPENVLNSMENLAKQGAKIWFVDDYPEKSHLSGCEVVSFKEITAKADACGFHAVKPREAYPNLRVFHTKRDEQDIFMLWNEDVNGEINTWVKFPVEGHAVFYDAWNNKIFRAEQEEDQVRIRLAPSEALIVSFEKEKRTLKAYDYRDGKKELLSLEWTISTEQLKDEKEFLCRTKELKNLAGRLPHFSGTICYEAEWEPEDLNVTAIEFEEVGEILKLWINEDECGEIVSKPYRLNMEGKLKQGSNRIRIEVINNLAYRERDPLSTYLPLPITGISGNVYTIK